MVKPLSKKALIYLSLILFIGYFAAFPFGQLVSFSIPFLSYELRTNFLDVVTFLSVALYILGARGKTKIDKYFAALVPVFGFTYLLSWQFFDFPGVVVGGLYLMRFASYYFFFRVITFLLQNSSFNLLRVISISFTTTLGIAFMQYVFLPDLRSFKYLGWDDHLYRLTGAFLDPGFAGIIFTSIFLFFLASFLKNKRPSTLFLSGTSLLAVLLTYSRASYLALVVGSLYMLYKTKAILVKYLVILFMLSIPFLPRPSSEGVKLERVYSAVSRVGSDQVAFEVGKKAPLFGVGFNNYCLATKANFSSHSCSASDSVILSVFATTGVVGLFYVFLFWSKTFTGLKNSSYTLLYQANFLAIFTHGLFTNTFFYPWVLGWFVFLLAVVYSNLKE